MSQKTKEQTQDARELTTEELEAVAGGFMIAGAIANALARQDPKYKCAVDPLACQH
jgi:hypothetical protein